METGNPSMRSANANFCGSVTGSQLFLLILFLFLVGCMLGYLLEVLFRRFITAKKWVNPGFMRGPWLPLYGFGLLIMFLACAFFYAVLPSSWHLYNPTGNLFDISYKSGPSVYDLVPICTMGASMTLIEFIAGLIFVKGFKVRLWDYSNMKGNIMGIVCPLFTLIWFAVAVIYYYALDPFVYAGAKSSFVFMFGDSEGGHATNVLSIFFLGVVYGLMLIDLIQSIGLFKSISSLAKKSGVVGKYEKFREEQKASRKEYKEKFISSLPASIQRSLKEPKKMTEATKKATKFLRSFFLINPDKKEKLGDNYDAEGRPISTKDETK